MSADTDRSRFPILKGLVESYDEKEEYNLGTWEGNPLDCYSSIITGIHVENVEIYGLGVIDGNAGDDNWWRDPKVKRGAFSAQDDIFKSLQKCDSPGDPGAEQSQLECASVFLHRAEVY